MCSSLFGAFFLFHLNKKGKLYEKKIVADNKDSRCWNGRKERIYTIIETERMTLRAMAESDAGNLMKIFGDAEAMKYYSSTKMNKTHIAGFNG